MQVQKVRTTTYLPADLMQLAKAEALASGISVTQLMCEGLETRLCVKPKIKKRLRLPSYNLGGKDYVFRRTDAYGQTSRS